MDILDQQDCVDTIRRIDALLSCGIFEENNRRHPLLQSAFIELMICLRDLLCKTEKHAKRISFADDVLINSYVNDITDAVIAIRDACCHIHSGKRHFDDNKNRFSFCVVSGKCTFAKIDDLELKSEYEDDIAFFYGKNRLYLKRNIIRSFVEAQTLIMPILHPSSRMSLAS